MALCESLVEQNLPAVAIHLSMTEAERLSRYQQFNDSKKGYTSLDEITCILVFILYFSFFIISEFW